MYNLTLFCFFFNTNQGIKLYAILLFNIIVVYFYCFCFSPNQDIQLYAIGLINSLFMRATNKKVSLQELVNSL